MTILDTPHHLTASFLIIIVVGVVLAVILSYLASKKADVQRRYSEVPEAPNPDAPPDDLAEKIQKLPLSSRNPKDAAQAIHRLLSEEVDKHTEQLKRDLQQQFQKTIEQKDQKLEQINKQYQEANVKFKALDQEYKYMGEIKKQTEAVVKSVAEGVVVVNNKGEMLMMNPAAERLLGIRSGDAVGKSIMNQSKEGQLVSFTRQIGDSKEKEITLTSQRDETRKILRASNAVIEDERGQTVGMVSVLTDVTKQRDLEELKSQFVANVSHELRTPIHAIRESVQLLLDSLLGELNEKQRKMLTLTARNIERLSRLINDVLDFSKIEAGKLRLKPTSFKVADIVAQTTATFDAWAKTKKVLMDHAQVDPRLEIEADSDRLSQVLTNLVGNALKFTPEGGTITIKSSAASSSSAKGAETRVRVSVQDTGPGISVKDKGRIFEKFGQGSAAKSSAVGGTGLGLSISKELIELHGGTIWVESEEGKGAEFIFEIPAKLPASSTDLTH